MPLSRRRWSRGASWMRLVLWMLLGCGHVTGFLSSRLPFVGEKSPVVQRKRPGCYMDGKHYAFGQRWSPVFIPQGLMVCIRCECLQVEKKGVFQAAGETMCRNIKDLCPEPSCSTPVLLPGKCCKTCPGDEDFEESFTFRPKGPVSNEVFSLDDANTARASDFQAVLVGRRVPGSPVRTRALASVRMSVGQGVMKYSVRYARLDRPKYLRLLDVRGNVLYQTPVIKSLNGDKKVCGVWRKMPPISQEYFRREKLYAVLTTARFPQGVIGGRVRATNGFHKETFSSLLVSETPRGDGALASMAFDPKTKVISYTIATEGMRGKKGRGRTFTVSIMKGSQLIYRTRGKAMPKTTKFSGRWRVAKRRHRKQLARGRLRMRVTFSDGQTLTGYVQPKQTCDVFQGVLSSGQTKDKKRTSGAGSAVIRLGDKGRLHYSIKFSGFERDVTRIQIEGHSSKSSSKVKTVGKLDYKPEQDGQKGSGGWASGTFKRLEAEDVYRLHNNQLFVSVSTVTAGGHADLRGRLVAMEYHAHFEHDATPITLVPASEQARGGGALVWLSLDSGCVLHYDVMLTGKGKRSGPFGLLLGRHGNGSQEMAVLRAPDGQRSEVVYQYRHVTGEVIDLSDDLFRDLDRGKAFLQVNAKRRGQAVFKGDVTIRNNCWRFSNDMDSRPVEEQELVDDPLLEAEEASPYCRFEGLIYSDGTAWTPDVDSACTTCSCVKGRTLCQKMPCPKLPCDHPVQLPGQCCPSCPHEDPAETCQLGRDPRKYPLHSTWHPYLPTQGFTTCALCTCKAGGKPECEKLPCPVLECPKSEWVPDPTNPCCYQCGPKITTEPPTEAPQGDVNMDGTCNYLGEIKANGEQWHPNVKPFGYLKCFLCTCTDGAFSCARMTCPRLDCAIKVKHRNVCCEECAADQSKAPFGKDSADVAKVDTQGQGVCVFAGTAYKEGEKWRPLAATPSDSTDCAVCKCVDGSTKCRLRCPKVCKTNRRAHKCCKHCPAKRDSRRKNNGKKKKRKKSRQRADPETPPEGVLNADRKSGEEGSSQGRKIRRKGKANERSRTRSQKVKLPSTKEFLSMLST